MGGGIEGMEFTGAKAILHKIYVFFILLVYGLKQCCMAQNVMT